MTPSAPPLANVLLRRVARHGSPEERRLFELHGNAIAGFLARRDGLPQPDAVDVDLAIENGAALGLTHTTRTTVALRRLLRDLDEAPGLALAAEAVIRHRAHGGLGLRVSPASTEYTLYVVDGPANAAATKVAVDMGWKIPQASGTGVIALSSTGTISRYSFSRPVPAGQYTELSILGSACGDLLASEMRRFLRAEDGSWQSRPAGIRVMPFPSHLLNVVLGRFDLRFTCLLHRGGTRAYGIVGNQGERQFLRTSLTTLASRPVPG